MNIIFLSRFGEGLDIAFRMALDGHSIRAWIEDPKCQEIGNGIVPKVKDWRSSVSWSDLAIIDYNSKGLTAIWKQIYKQVPCFGGSEFANKLESDRGYAHSLMDLIGLKRLESVSFKTLKEAHKHLKEHPVAHVVKPSGGKADKHHLIIGKSQDNSDALDQLERLMDQNLPIESVEVEEKKSGVEVGIAGFFNGSDWVGPCEINFEHKRSHEHETGFMTGELGTLMKYLENKDIPIWKDTLAKMTPVLRAHNYRGQIDLNMICNEEGFWPLEFTPRLGYPAVFLEDELHVSPWADLFLACATGRDIGFNVHYDWCVGVVLTAFGFPFGEKVETISKGLIVRGLDEHTIDHIHPQNLCVNKKGKFEVSQGDGYLLVATGRGGTIQEAKSKAYGHLSAVQVPNSSHRFDIGDKIYAGELDRLNILPIEEAIDA